MFNSYDSCTQRLDSFFNKLNVQQYESLSHFIKCILVLFNGQSQVERSFSVNKALMNGNVQEKTVINKRSVKDFMPTHKLKPYEVKITKDLKSSVLFAQEHYRAWLEKNRLFLERHEREDRKVRKRELQDLQNKREKTKRSISKFR